MESYRTTASSTVPGKSSEMKDGCASIGASGPTMLELRLMRKYPQIPEDDITDGLAQNDHSHRRRLPQIDYRLR